ncbi:MAG: hypothetical protein DIZ78_12550 [endosymbiont of Escarpia spicata]|uniref:Uncharacterized protein n=1 Tax=endosymbiont of Escarpia spicata TaxID=2200908 RepID=A0A370DHP0_9GAMM|nr:MAG: hypothetical protein DIZ78_12550 [endosymbiont of Escarpia spicata]
MHLCFLYTQLGSTVIERTASYRELFVRQFDTTKFMQIRQASNQGMALGNGGFKPEVKRLAGHRVVPLKREPKPKQINNK